MERQNVPFTVFVTTGMMTGEIDAWWFGLSRLIATLDSIALADKRFDCSDRNAKRKLRATSFELSDGRRHKFRDRLARDVAVESRDRQLGKRAKLSASSPREVHGAENGGHVLCGRPVHGDLCNCDATHRDGTMRWELMSSLAAVKTPPPMNSGRENLRMYAPAQGGVSGRRRRTT